MSDPRQLDPRLQDPNSFKSGSVQVTNEVKGENHTPEEAEKSQATINELKAASAARRAAQAAKKKD